MPEAPKFEFVQPSSLIFLVLIGIWAAYLLQHWVRRREHLATARSVDRFSDAMRVLERRSPLPDLDLPMQRPRSYAIGPARHSRPEVVVKRAHPVRPDVGAAPEGAASEAVVRSTRTFRILAGVSARRLRGLSLLGALLLVLVASPMAALSVLPWWGVLIAVAALMADVAMLRHVAVSQRAIRGTNGRRARSEPSTAGQPARQPTYFEDESQPLFDSEQEPEVTDASAVTEPIEAPVPVDPAGWAPVPVPPPTYTLKAKAADPVIAPQVVTEAGEAQGWSLDGMVYDCDLDELVERRRATGA
jgi:hypothetical protein